MANPEDERNPPVSTESNSDEGNRPMGSQKFEIERFDGSNDFTIWKVKVRRQLIHLGLNAALTEDFPSKWKASRRQDCIENAKISILLELSDNILRDHIQYKSAKQLWTALEEKYQSKDFANVYYLKTKLFRLRMRDGDSMTDHLNVFTKIIVDLQAIDVEIPDLDQALHLLNTLPPSYDTLIETLTYGGREITLKHVKTALLNREMKDQDDHYDDDRVGLNVQRGRNKQDDDQDEEIVYGVKSYVSVQHEPVAVPHQNFPFAEEEEEEEEEEEAKKAVAVDEGCRRIKHYNSTHRILLVGEGDFSFSACLAKAFGTASNMVATSLNSQEFLHKNYANAASNIAELTTRNCVVLHGIDATQMHQHEFLRRIPFDRVIFNFPHAGFFSRDMAPGKQLRRHRRLVRLFLKNAKEMIGLDGEIHVTHKTCGLQKDWNLESIASSHGLKLIKAVKFRQRDYPGYHTKYGFGGDKDFDCNPSKTYMFGFK